VLIFTFSPSLMKSDTRTSMPVSSLASLVTLPDAVSPLAPGSVDATVNSTCCGSCRPIALPLKSSNCTTWPSTRKSRASPSISSRSVMVS